MLKHTTGFLAALLWPAIALGGALAAPLTSTAAIAEGRQTFAQPVRNDGRDLRKPIWRIVAAGQSAGEKCGVWRCTWPTSGGGCLVWEKTLCKIKTIDPFN